jgi:hypothetical protein
VLYRELSHVRRALVTVECFHIAVTREDGRKKRKTRRVTRRYVGTSCDFVRKFGRGKAVFDDDERARAKTDL